MNARLPWMTTLLALLASPWLVFISSSLGLHLTNQTELYSRYDVLTPYAIYAGLLYLLGVLCIPLARHWPRTETFIWAHLLLGPVFLLWQTCIGFITNDFRLYMTGAALCAFYVLAIGLSHRGIAIKQGVQTFAIIACAYIAVDAISFRNAFSAAESSPNIALSSQETSSQNAHRPNIYHLVLDEYQTDMFSLTLNESVKTSLGGFTWFSDTRTVFGRTEMSLPSIFSGRRYDFSSAPLDYQTTALGANSPLLSTLKKAGYSTKAVMYPVFDFELQGFNSVSYHEQVRERDYSAVTSVFLKLWLYSILPEPLVGRFLDAVDMDQLKHRNLLSLSAPLESYESMQKIIASEKFQRGHNRYEFIHLLIPHFPNVLREDCSYVVGTTSSPAEQAHCATKLTIRFIDELKRLGRFRDALIIVQSDHGASYKLVDGQLRGLGQNDTARFGPAWSNARSRSLLLIKPPGTDDTTTFYQSETNASLLDIAPSIANMLSLNLEGQVDGFNLPLNKSEKLDRTRYYYFYNKRGTKGRHFEKMTRFRIEDSGLVDEGIVGSGEFK